MSIALLNLAFAIPAIAIAVVPAAVMMRKDAADHRPAPAAVLALSARPTPPGPVGEPAPDHVEALVRVAA